MGMPELEIYSMIGAEGFGRLVAAIYRQAPQATFWGQSTRLVIFQGPSSASEIS